MVQLRTSVHTKAKQRSDEPRLRAADFLEEQGHKLNSVGLAQLAVRFRNAADPFSKVKGMIQDMIDRLIKEEAEEASHKAWCDDEIAESTKSRDQKIEKVDVLTTRIDKATAAVAKLSSDVATLQKEIAEMNKAEKEATEQRHAEHAEFMAATKDYAEALEGLSQAIQVLTDYYGAKGGEALLLQARQPEFSGPVFEGGYANKAEGASGIIGILEVAQSDYSKMDAEAKADEAESAKEFEKMVNDNAVSRATKEQDVKGKSAEIARLQDALGEMQADRTSQQKELDAVLTYIEKLRGACQVQPMSYEERTKRRRAEIEALQEALEILAGEEAP